MALPPLPPDAEAPLLDVVVFIFSRSSFNICSASHRDFDDVDCNLDLMESQYAGPDVREGERTSDDIVVFWVVVLILLPTGDDGGIAAVDVVVNPAAAAAADLTAAELMVLLFASSRGAIAASATVSDGLAWLDALSASDDVVEAIGASPASAMLTGVVFLVLLYRLLRSSIRDGGRKSKVLYRCRCFGFGLICSRE